MQSRIKADIEKYRYYSVENFLQDDFFISSVGNPTEESVEFWDQFVRENQNTVNYNSARLYIESLSESEVSLSEEEVEDMWKNILAKNKLRKRLFLKRVPIYAAGVAVVLLFMVWYQFKPSPDPTIYDYASEKILVDRNVDQAQLILSEDKVVLIEDKESEITYESANIKVKDENISTKEVAVYNQLVVPRGKRSALTFSDGTKMWVNAGTRVVYPSEFDNKEREIYVDGEVYIEVAHDDNWPFVVKTKDIGIKVLGTAFNVTAYESDELKRVVLASGSVKISRREEKKEILLSPSEMYEIGENIDEKSNVDVYKYISWKDGMYIYENERLENILARLSVYYAKEIICDKASKDLKCSGKLDLKNDLKDVLIGLTYTAPVFFEEKNGVYALKYKP